jgi:hypothetical protein
LCQSLRRLWRLRRLWLRGLRLLLDMGSLPRLLARHPPQRGFRVGIARRLGSGDGKPHTCRGLRCALDGAAEWSELARCQISEEMMKFPPPWRGGFSLRALRAKRKKKRKPS